jgi:hypothetical protein
VDFKQTVELARQRSPIIFMFNFSNSHDRSRFQNRNGERSEAIHTFFAAR